MKRLLTLTPLAILFCLSANSQTIKKKYYDPYIQSKLMEEYQVNSAGEKHGWYKGYDRNGILFKEYSFKNGYWDGLNKDYATSTGRQILAKTTTYSNGVLNGPAKYYIVLNDKNIIGSEGNYSNDEREGQWMDLKPSYELTDEQRINNPYIKHLNYYTNGKLIFKDGTLTTWYYPSGQIRSTHEIKQGMKNGAYKFYYVDGKLKEEGSFENDKKNGQWIFYNQDGAVVQKTMFSNDYMDGKCTYYDLSNPSSILTEGDYSKGYRIGDWKIFYDKDWKETLSSKDAKFYRTITIDNNYNSIGLVKDYYINGQIQSEVELSKIDPETRNGIWKSFYENGNIKQEGLYKNNQAAGNWKFYYESGALQTNKNFDENSWVTYDEQGNKLNERIEGGRYYSATKYYGQNGELVKTVDDFGYQMDKHLFQKSNIKQLAYHIKKGNTSEFKMKYSQDDIYSEEGQIFSDIIRYSSISSENKEKIKSLFSDYEKYNFRTQEKYNAGTKLLDFLYTLI